MIQHTNTDENAGEGTVQVYSVALNGVIEVGRHLYVSVWAVNGVSAINILYSLVIREEEGKVLQFN